LGNTIMCVTTKMSKSECKGNFHWVGTNLTCLRYMVLGSGIF